MVSARNGDWDNLWFQLTKKRLAAFTVGVSGNFSEMTPGGRTEGWGLTLIRQGQRYQDVPPPHKHADLKLPETHPSETGL